MRGPLKGWSREDTALTDPFSIQDPPITCTGLDLQVVQIVLLTEDVEQHSKSDGVSTAAVISRGGR